MWGDIMVENKKHAVIFVLIALITVMIIIANAFLIQGFSFDSRRACNYALTTLVETCDRVNDMLMKTAIIIKRSPTAKDLVKSYNTTSFAHAIVSHAMKLAVEYEHKELDLDELLARRETLLREYRTVKEKVLKIVEDPSYYGSVEEYVEVACAVEGLLSSIEEGDLTPSLASYVRMNPKQAYMLAASLDLAELKMKIAMEIAQAIQREKTSKRASSSKKEVITPVDMDIKEEFNALTSLASALLKEEPPRNTAAHDAWRHAKGYLCLAMKDYASGLQVRGLVEAYIALALAKAAQDSELKSMPSYIHCIAEGDLKLLPGEADALRRLVQDIKGIDDPVVKLAALEIARGYLGDAVLFLKMAKRSATYDMMEQNAMLAYENMKIAEKALQSLLSSG